jgi:hypothetical protein
MPHFSPSERIYKLEEFLDDIDLIIEIENFYREKAREGNPEWNSKYDGLPPEPEGFEDGMFWNPTKQITEWQFEGIPSWFYHIARHRIWKWLKEKKRSARRMAATARWNKNPSTGAGQSGSAKPKSKKGMVKSKKDKRLGPRLPEAGKKIKKIIEGA